MASDAAGWSCFADGGMAYGALGSPSMVTAVKPERPPPNAARAATPGSQLPSEDLEVLYQRLGRTRGPFGTREAHAELRREWASKGWDSALWLLHRARREHHIDVLDAVAEVLAAHKDQVIPTIDQCFVSARAEERDYQALLLRAAKLARTSPREDQRLTEMGLDGARSPDTEVREAAYLLLGTIGTEVARSILRSSIVAERNEAARETAREALEG